MDNETSRVRSADQFFFYINHHKEQFSWLVNRAYYIQLHMYLLFTSLCSCLSTLCTSHIDEGRRLIVTSAHIYSGYCTYKASVICVWKKHVDLLVVV